MGFDAWMTVAAIGAAFTAMTAGAVSADRALTAALAGLVLLGVASPEQALSGLSNPGVATVALLFVVAAAVRRTGVLGSLVDRALGKSQSPSRAQARLMVPVAGLSAFLNNTPIVAMLLPAVRHWSGERGHSPSFFLIPLSYASIVGGMCTLIGTSTNLLIDGLLVERGHPHLGLFWISALGVPCAVLAILTILALGRVLLPRRGSRQLPFSDSRSFTAEFVVEPGGPLVGKRLADISVPGLRSFAPVEIEREGVAIAAPQRGEPLQSGDTLHFAAPSAEVIALHRLVGLTPRRRDVDDEDPGAGGPAGVLVEAVVGHRCPLISETVGDGSFRRHYGAAVIAVARDGREVPAKHLGSWEIEVGDTLLLEADADFVSRHRYSTELILATSHGRPTPHATWHARFCLGVVAVMATFVALGLAPMLGAALGAVVVLLLAGVIRWEEVARDVDWRILLAIVSALGLGAALEDTGAAAVAAEWLVASGGDRPWLTLALVYVATAVVTEVVTNNVAAVLMLPIALSSAASLEVSPWPFVAVVMIAASAAFVTPIGYQTNLMVYGPGGYRFRDFARMGLPVSLVVAAAAVGLAPFFWPL